MAGIVQALRATGRASDRLELRPAHVIDLLDLNLILGFCGVC
jgi:hypothetical protein